MSQSQDTDDGAPELQWGASIETLLARWCDEAKANEWMHTEAAGQNNRTSRGITIALTILSSVAGLSNVIAGGKVWAGDFQPSWLFGGLSIGISVLTMIQEKLAYGTAATQHGLWAQQWTLIRRRIEEELAIPPSMRKSVQVFMKTLRHDINQVSIAGSQQLPESIRDSCKKRFSNIPQFELPEICGVAEHTRIYMPLPAEGVVS